MRSARAGCLGRDNALRADDQAVAFDHHATGVAAIRRVEAKQVRESVRIREVVDRHELQRRFVDDQLQDRPSDPAETIDRDSRRHFAPSVVFSAKRKRSSTSARVARDRDDRGETCPSLAVSCASPTQPKLSPPPGRISHGSVGVLEDRVPHATSRPCRRRLCHHARGTARTPAFGSVLRRSTHTRGVAVAGTRSNGDFVSRDA